nr:MAG TPA: hypothetical protein [Caudoviricetes sp.]
MGYISTFGSFFLNTDNNPSPSTLDTRRWVICQLLVFYPISRRWVTIKLSIIK